MSANIDAIRAAGRGTFEPPSHPDERMLAVDARFSGPRFVFVTEAELDALEASPGMYAYVAATPGSKRSDRVVQRVGKHWEIVAEPLLGTPTGGEDERLMRETPTPFGLAAGGGSGVSVAPRGPGDPSVTDPMGPSPYSTQLYLVNESPPITGTALFADGEVTLWTMGPIGGVLTQQQWGVLDPSLRVVQAAPCNWIYRIYLNGVVVEDGANSGDVLVSPTTFGNVGQSAAFSTLHNGDVLHGTIEVLDVGGSADYEAFDPFAYVLFLVF